MRELLARLIDAAAAGRAAAAVHRIVAVQRRRRKAAVHRRAERERQTLRAAVVVVVRLAGQLAGGGRVTDETVDRPQAAQRAALLRLLGGVDALLVQLLVLALQRAALALHVGQLLVQLVAFGLERVGGGGEAARMMGVIDYHKCIPK